MSRCSLIDNSDFWVSQTSTRLPWSSMTVFTQLFNFERSTDKPSTRWEHTHLPPLSTHHNWANNKLWAQAKAAGRSVNCVRAMCVCVCVCVCVSVEGGRERLSIPAYICSPGLCSPKHPPGNQNNRAWATWYSFLMHTGFMAPINYYSTVLVFKYVTCFRFQVDNRCQRFIVTHFGDETSLNALKDLWVGTVHSDIWAGHKLNII